MNQRVLVVGAQGALGHAVVELAAQRGQPVRALARRLRADFFPPRVELRQGDASDTTSLNAALADCSALLFCVNVPIATWDERMPRRLDSALTACAERGARRTAERELRRQAAALAPLPACPIGTLDVALLIVPPGRRGRQTGNPPALCVVESAAGRR